MDLWKDIKSHGDKSYSYVSDWIGYTVDAFEWFQDVQILWPVCLEHIDEELAQWIIGDIVLEIRHRVSSILNVKSCLGYNFPMYSIPFAEGVPYYRGLLESVMGDDRFHLYIQYDALDALIELESAVELVTNNLIHVLRRVADKKEILG